METKIMELRDFINGKEILDVERVGFVDLDEKPLRFYTGLDYTCVKIGTSDTKTSKYLEIQHHISANIENNADIQDNITFTGLLFIRLIDEIRFPDDYEENTDYVNCVSSVEQEVLLFPDASNTIDDIIFHGLIEKEDAIICGALEIIAGKNLIFFDPFSFDGTLIEGVAKKQDWIENFKFQNDEKLPQAISLFGKIYNDERSR